MRQYLKTVRLVTEKDSFKTFASCPHQSTLLRSKCPTDFAVMESMSEIILL